MKCANFLRHTVRPEALKLLSLQLDSEQDEFKDVRNRAKLEYRNKLKFTFMYPSFIIFILLIFNISSVILHYQRIAYLTLLVVFPYTVFLILINFVIAIKSQLPVETAWLDLFQKRDFAVNLSESKMRENLFITARSYIKMKYPSKPHYSTLLQSELSNKKENKRIRSYLLNNEMSLILPNLPALKTEILIFIMFVISYSTITTAVIFILAMLEVRVILIFFLFFLLLFFLSLIYIKFYPDQITDRIDEFLISEGYANTNEHDKNNFIIKLLDERFPYINIENNRAI